MPRNRLKIDQKRQSEALAWKAKAATAAAGKRKQPYTTQAPRPYQKAPEPFSAANILSAVWTNAENLPRKDPRLAKMCAPRLLRGCRSCDRCTSHEGGNAYWCEKSQVCVPKGCHNCPLKRRECKFFESECPTTCEAAKLKMFETPKKDRWRLWDAGLCGDEICLQHDKDAPNCYRIRPKETQVKVGQKCFPGQYIPMIGKLSHFPTTRNLCCENGYVREGIQSFGDFSCDAEVNIIPPTHWALLSDSDMENKCEEPGGGTCTATCTPNSTKFPVRCCAENHMPGWANEQCSDLWSSSENWRTRPRECLIMTYLDAAQFCRLEGGRLCTKKEVDMQCVKRTGCGFDNRLIWSDTPCVWPEKTVAREARAAYILSWLDPATRKGRIMLQVAIACVFLIPVMLCLIILGYCRWEHKRSSGPDGAGTDSSGKSVDGAKDDGPKCCPYLRCFSVLRQVFPSPQPAQSEKIPLMKLPDIHSVHGKLSKAQYAWKNTPNNKEDRMSRTGSTENLNSEPSGKLRRTNTQITTRRRNGKSPRNRKFESDGIG